MTNRWTGPAVLAAYALIWMLVASVAHGQTAVQRFEGDFARGYCAAVAQVMHNRDRYRAMVKFPAETHAESMKRIYEKWPPRPPSGFEEKTIIDRQLNLEMAGIDLYVVLSPQMCERAGIQ